ncbi:UNVERIFIED_CONTAM: hypothetical protein PYX00_010975 [Menopon gallinae]|uniref:Zinc transporter ZIP11 n=1 Tax=Menopon gallinae TaxID=328185 RepID=A0AAW2H6R2_9NEOP
MSVGVATANGVSQGLTISLGLGLHNITEGLAVSVPLLAAGLNPWVAFFLGQLSGLVYPLSSVLSTYFTLSNTYLMPYMLAFAAGCMIFVSVEDLLPNAYEKQNRISASLPFLIGFVVMMWFENLLD